MFFCWTFSFTKSEVLTSVSFLFWFNKVHIRVHLKCQALSEDQFKPIIADNYYTQNHFRFELDHVQVTKLISVFSSLTVGSGSWISRSPKKSLAVVKRSPSNENVEKIGPSDPTYSNGDIANANDFIETSADSDDSQSCNKNQLKEASPCNQMQEPDEKDIIYVKLRELAFSHAPSDVNILECSRDSPNLVFETHCNPTITSGKGKDESSYSFHYPAFVSRVLVEVSALLCS